MRSAPTCSANIISQPDLIVELSCGKGNFLAAALDHFTSPRALGVEINPEYCRICCKRLAALPGQIKIAQADAFEFDFVAALGSSHNVLVVGNPPWINSATLSVLGADNLPVKSNFKRRGGLQALTGDSNFELAESFCLRLLEAMTAGGGLLVFLCTTSTARCLFAELCRRQAALLSCEIREFDARQVFGIEAAACLFVAQLAAASDRITPCASCSCGSLHANGYEFELSVQGGRIVRSLPAHVPALSGQCVFSWRQSQVLAKSQGLQTKLRKSDLNVRLPG